MKELSVYLAKCPNSTHQQCTRTSVSLCRSAPEHQHPPVPPYVPAVAAHDLENEAALVAVGGGDDGVDGLHDAVQGGVRADGHVSAAEVVVDRANHAHDVQVGILHAVLVGDVAYQHHKKKLIY